jgi:hypothetical protein
MEEDVAMATPAMCMSCGTESDYPAGRGCKLAEMKCHYCRGELRRAGRNPCKAVVEWRAKRGMDRFGAPTGEPLKDITGCDV